MEHWVHCPRGKRNHKFTSSVRSSSVCIVVKMQIANRSATSEEIKGDSPGKVSSEASKRRLKTKVSKMSDNFVLFIKYFFNKKRLFCLITVLLTY